MLSLTHENNPDFTWTTASGILKDKSGSVLNRIRVSRIYERKT